MREAEDLFENDNQTNEADDEFDFDFGDDSVSTSKAR